MSTKAERLAAFIKELRGSCSQRRFCQQLGVSNSCVNFWESGLAWPDTGNLEKLAALKGWSLADLQTYLVKGELPSDEPVERILKIVSCYAARLYNKKIEIISNCQLICQPKTILTKSKQKDCLKL